MRILVVGGNPRNVEDITFCLQLRYPEVVAVLCSDGAKAPETVQEQLPDLIILHSILQANDSIELIKKIREFSDIPLFVLCDVNEKTDMTSAKYFEAGAGDVMSQPFGPMEFLARVKALLRRSKGLSFSQGHSIFVGGQLTVDFNTHEVFVSGKRVKLTAIEYKLLSELVRNEGMILTHRQLLGKAWGPEYREDDSYIKTYIYRLRSKLQGGVNGSKMLVNERGVGYGFVRPGSN